MAPWLIGFFGLFVGPGLYSLFLSFNKYDVMSAPEFIGLKNYVDMFTRDDLFWPSLLRTLSYAAALVPLSIVGSLGMQAPRFSAMLRMVEAGKLAPGKLVQRTIGLEDVSGVLESMDSFATVGVTVIERYE